MAETFLGLNRKDFQSTALGFGGLGIGLSMGGQIMSGYNQSGQIRSSATSLRNAAKVSEWNAEISADQTELRTKAQRRKWQKAIGTQRALISAGGGDPYDLNQSMAAGVIESIGEMETEIELMRYAGDVEAWNYNRDRDRLLAQASIYDEAADNAIYSGWLGGVGSAIEGTLAVGKNYFDVQ